ncbi:uncharacterized protein LY89DRAFT_789328 [Mollisia scopiformis]|uniref:2EXR domain-containing protein n=1 Tax=Mollisia scopiformis TaxID=149040 RepID=A0A132B6Q8_MOLSC|nr:uncharacterized protein LY89DRAFT_789328 [Mollisia scopiformis]KUJ08092.1 hypothetical protein LY89DRAFT_789328 [Mollisia scopiformis]
MPVPRLAILKSKMSSMLKNQTRSTNSRDGGSRETESKKTGFSDLPYELRRKIFLLTLPEPRVLQVTRKKQQVPPQTNRKTTAKSQSASSPEKYTVNPSSYGLHHASALSINNESREIALSKLTKVFGVYWNLDIDWPYFEITHDAHEDVDLLAEVRKAGYLKLFKNIAIDRMLWNWDGSTNTMEFRVTFGHRFHGYEHPLETLKHLPNIKKCAIVYTEHTLQKDILKPYAAWNLGPPSLETTMWIVGKMEPVNNWDEDLEQTVSHIEQNIETRKGKVEFGNDVEFEVMSIHGRAREFIPDPQRKRGLSGWQMDWFG